MATGKQILKAYGDRSEAQTLKIHIDGVKHHAKRNVADRFVSTIKRKEEEDFHVTYEIHKQVPL
jgi:hypothetical protein